MRYVCSSERHTVLSTRKEKWHILRLDSYGYSFCFLKAKYFSLQISTDILLVLKYDTKNIGQTSQAWLGGLAPYVAWRAPSQRSRVTDCLLAPAGLKAPSCSCSSVWLSVNICNGCDSFGFVCFQSHDLVLEKIFLLVFTVSKSLHWAENIFWKLLVDLKQASCLSEALLFQM